MINPDTEDTMADETGAELGAGLSDQEIEALENLVRELKQEETAPASEQRLDELYSEVRSTKEQLAQFGEMILKLDSRMKSFYELLRLHYEKSQIMNKRIDSIIGAGEGEKGVQSGSE
jgi:uncharacterized coiled-coil DUF342 family protein